MTILLSQYSCERYKNLSEDGKQKQVQEKILQNEKKTLYYNYKKNFNVETFTSL